MPPKFAGKRATVGGGVHHLDALLRRRVGGAPLPPMELYTLEELSRNCEDCGQFHGPLYGFDAQSVQEFLERLTFCPCAAPVRRTRQREAPKRAQAAVI